MQWRRTNVKKRIGVFSCCVVVLGIIIVANGCFLGAKKKELKFSGDTLSAKLGTLSNAILKKISSKEENSVAILGFTVSKLESARGGFFSKQLTITLPKVAKKRGDNVTVLSRPALLEKLQKGGFSEYDLVEPDKFISLMKAVDCDYGIVGNMTERQYTYLVEAKVMSWKGEEILTTQIEILREDIAAEKVNLFGKAMEKLAHKLIDGYQGFDTHKVAVYEFKDNNIRTLLGQQIAKELPNYLSKVLEKSVLAGQFEILTRTQLDQIVREKRITLDEMFEQNDTDSFSKLLKATAIISGDIAHREGGIYLTAQMVDSNTGKLISTGEVRYTEEAVGRGKPRDIIGDTALSTERDPETGLPLEILHEKDNSVMVLVPEGLFDGYSFTGKKKEKVKKNIITFYIDKYEVTNEQYVKFLNSVGRIKGSSGETYMGYESDGSKIYTKRGVFAVRDGYEKHPVINVSYYGAMAYAQWAGKRLPEVLEWEKAAGWDPVKRTFRKYPWGKKWKGSRCNHGKKSGGEDDSDGYAKIAEVMKFEKGKSFYNVFNMAGNVWEWCGTVEKEVEYIDNFGDKVQKIVEKGRVMGGSFRKGGDEVTTTSALLLDPDIVNYSIGFRCVKDTE